MGENGDEWTHRDRRFADVVAQHVMARVLDALQSAELGERMSHRWEAGVDRIVARALRRLAIYAAACALVGLAAHAGMFDHIAERLRALMIENQELIKQVPGLMGSLAAMLWVRDTWPRRVGYMLAGTAASHYGAPTAALWLSADLALSGFLVGLFGMACAAKIFESLEALPARDLVERVLKRVGL